MQQRAGLLILQRNIRSWCTLRTVCLIGFLLLILLVQWDWFKLYGRVKPMLKAGKEAEELEKIAGKIKELEDALTKEQQLRKEAEDQGTKLLEEKNQLFSTLETTKASLSDAEDRLGKLQSQKNELDRELADVNDRLADQEDRNADLSEFWGYFNIHLLFKVAQRRSSNLKSKA